MRGPCDAISVTTLPHILATIHATDRSSKMYTEIFNMNGEQVPCAFQIKCHAMVPIRVGLTKETRLQSVYTCVDCGTSCVKKTRECSEYATNTEKNFNDVLCVEFTDNSTMATGYV